MKYWLKKFISELDNSFGTNVFVIRDYWNSDFAKGFEKDNKLIYVEYKNKNDYFYELELLLNDPDKVYKSKGSGSVNTTQQIIEIMSKFFNLPIKSIDK